MRVRHSIVIRNEDHLSDSLGIVFMLEQEQLNDTLIEKLREYLGDAIQVRQAVVARDRLEVEVEAVSMREASDRLVDASAGLMRNHLYRSAESMLRDALKLDPINPRALAALGELFESLEKYPEALASMVRAREASGNDSAELLATLGCCCVKAGRTAAAIMYLEEALSIDPLQFSARRALASLGRKPPSAVPKRPPEMIGHAQRKPHVKH
jgi:tetratricopeptide (TPR) repeat protein